MRDRNIELKESETVRENMYGVGESHLIDVFEFVDDLIYHRICCLDFDFRVDTLSFDPVSDHTEGVAVNKGQ